MFQYAADHRDRFGYSVIYAHKNSGPPVIFGPGHSVYPHAINFRLRRVTRGRKNDSSLGNSDGECQYAA